MYVTSTNAPENTCALTKEKGEKKISSSPFQSQRLQKSETPSSLESWSFKDSEADL